MSQRGLAFPGCSPAYISRVEAGDRTPSPHLLRELAERLGVSESWLALGRERVATNLLRDAEIALRLDQVEEASALFGEALDEADDASSRSVALEGLAQIALRNGEPRRAVALAEEALEATGEQPEDRPAIADTLARSYAALAEMAPAIGVLRRCVDQFAEDPVQFVRFSALLGAALTDNGDFAEAERVIGDALARGREIADPYTRARLYWSQSRVLLEAGRSEDAEEYAQRTLHILRATEDGYAVAHILQTLAKIKIDLGRPQEALDMLREGWPKLTAVATPIEVAQYRIEEARALAALGDHEEAAALAMELTNALDGIEPVDGGRAYVLLGDTFVAIGDPHRAREVYELGVELLERQPPSRYLVTAYKSLGALLKDQGEAEAAFELLERALGVQDRVGRALA